MRFLVNHNGDIKPDLKKLWPNFEIGQIDARKSVEFVSEVQISSFNVTL